MYHVFLCHNICLLEMLHILLGVKHHRDESLYRLAGAVLALMYQLWDLD